VYQLLGQKDSPRLRHRYGRCAEMQLEQSPQLLCANTEPRRKGVDVGFVERSLFNQR
jgi:hypothetical protein